MQNIKAEQSGVNLTHSNFTSGSKTSVRVDAVLTCCQRDVSFLLSDVVGNLHKCSFSLPPLVMSANISKDVVASSPSSYLDDYLTEPPDFTAASTVTDSSNMDWSRSSQLTPTVGDAPGMDSGSGAQPTIPTQGTQAVYILQLRRHQ